MSEESSDLTFVAVCSTSCPFCGAEVQASDGSKGGEPGVLHGMPMCKKFEELEPDRFMYELNEAIAKKRGITIVRGVHG